MGAKEQFTVSHVIEALRATRGLKGPASKKLGCTYQTVNNYAKRHPTVQQAIDEEREMLLDIGELSLARATQNGEAWAVCFLLKTLGKHRGFVERAEHTGKDGGPIEQKVEHTDSAQRQQRFDELFGQLDAYRVGYDDRDREGHPGERIHPANAND